MNSANRPTSRNISINATAEEIATAIAEQLQTPEPAELKLPTWDDCATQLADVYRMVLAR